MLNKLFFQNEKKKRNANGRRSVKRSARRKGNERNSEKRKGNVRRRRVLGLQREIADFWKTWKGAILPIQFILEREKFHRRWVDQVRHPGEPRNDVITNGMKGHGKLKVEMLVRKQDH